MMSVLRAAWSKGRGLLAGLAVLMLAGSADAALINTSERGWYDQNGFHAPSNDNYIAGQIGGAVQFHNFFVFDVSSFSGTALSATLLAFNPVIASPDPSETYTLFDASTSAAVLTSGAGGVGAYADLGGGTVLGSAVVPQTANNTTVVITLNAAGLAALTASFGGTFVLGGAVTSINTIGADEFVFGFSGGATPADGLTQLDFTVGPGGPVVPEPSTIALAGMAAALFGLARWRRRRSA